MIRCKIELHDIGNTCPLCGEQALDAAMDERHGGQYFDTHKCDNCGVLVTYVTKDGDRREYHEYGNGEIEVQLEWPFGHSKPDDEEMPEEMQHTGFYTTVDGVPVHIQGDPNMSEEQAVLLQKIIQAAIVMVQGDEGKLHE